MAYDAFFSTVFSRFDPETSHEWAFRAIRAGRPVSRGLYRVPSTPAEVMGLPFANRFGLAAGFDKNARGVLGLLALGFGHVEIGTVTAQGQPGNPKPRLFRLTADESIINRMGFNNDGAAVVASRLHRLRQARAGRDALIGVNIGKSKVTAPDRAVEDYTESTRLLAGLADYLVVNVSSPNTPGLRDLQAVDQLEPILAAVKEITDRTRHHRLGTHGVPLVVKIAPDLVDDDVDAVFDLALRLELAGVSVANTTIARPESLATDRHEIEQIGAGGLSGPILAPRSLELTARAAKQLGGRLAVISVGGVTRPADVKVRLAAGADLVQGYTGFIYGGPGWPSKMARMAV